MKRLLLSGVFFIIRISFYIRRAKEEMQSLYTNFVYFSCLFVQGKNIITSPPCSYK